MSELTTEQVKAMLARAEAATPGPWEAYFTSHGDPLVILPGQWKTGRIASISTSPEDYGRSDNIFIAAARTDVPLLAREVLRLREEMGTVGGMAHQLVEERTKLLEECDQLRESLRWALDSSPWAYPTERGTCAVCEAIPHTADCPYARALKRLEEKP